ncbi:MAG: PRC-barrel domain-containing protein [Thermomicrobium sp.]|nr:PRC-barrel domain-containing protein [Thermomicrobium sp.]
MHIELGRPVMSRDGKRIGTVDQLVLDPVTREVQAIIVHRGLLLSEDRIVDRALIDAVAPDGTVWLSLDAERADELPRFVEAEFVRLTDEEAATLPYVWPSSGAMGPIPIFWGTPISEPTIPEPRVAPYDPSGGTLPSTPVVAAPPVEVATNLPPEAVRIDRGTAVVAADGERLGKVEHVHLNEDGEIVSLAVDPGLFGGEHLHIPAAWIASVTEDEIRLSVDAATARRGKR